MKLSNEILKKIAKIITLAYFLLFPFGQILRLEYNFYGKTVAVIAVDVIAALSLFFYFGCKKPKISRNIHSFLLVAVFSLLLSLSYFSLAKTFTGSLYLFRIIIYYSFFVLIKNLIKDKTFKDILFIVFMSSVVLAAIFGWIQYFFYSDLTYLKYLGWDDHLGRLVGTYLDPGFTGIIILAGFFATFLKFVYGKKKIYLYISIFLLMSVIFSYSRASYLAFLSGLSILYFLKKSALKPLIFIAVLFSISIPFLPRPQSEGVKLERTRSIVTRFNNYRQTLSIITKYPLFGVGFNNICWVRNEIYKDPTYSHSCSGSDSSLLLIIATTGIVGFLIFSKAAFTIFDSLSSGYFEDLTKVFLIALFVHSFFTNSFFYPWVLGINAYFISNSIKD